MIPRSTFSIGTYEVQPRSVRRQRLRALREIRRWLSADIAIRHIIADLGVALGPRDEIDEWMRDQSGTRMWFS